MIIVVLALVVRALMIVSEGSMIGEVEMPKGSSNLDR